MGKMEIQSLKTMVWVLSLLALGWMGAVSVQAAGVGQESLSLEGPMVQGGLVQGKTAPGATVWVDGRKVRVSPQGMFLVGFGRDASPTVKLAITWSNGTKEHRVLSVKKRKISEHAGLLSHAPCTVRCVGWQRWRQCRAASSVSRAELVGAGGLEPPTSTMSR